MRPLTRRALLRSAVATPALVACDRVSPPAPAPARPEVAAAAREEERLIALYDTALAALPPTSAVAPLLLAVRDEHVAHLVAFGGQPTAAGAGTSSPAAPAATAAPLAAAPTVAALAQAEREAAAAHASAAVAAPHALAQLLASAAASEESHAVVLGLAVAR